MAAEVEIDFVERLYPLLAKPKRIKILVGGRASTKSTFVADHVLARMASGERWCCAREYQNSIEESVHSMLSDEIERLQFPGFIIQKNTIIHESGGRNFYRGLARNITSLKSFNAHGLWIEEGEATSKQTLKVLTASLRVSALEQAKAKREGKVIRIPEIWITMNRGSSKDPIAQRLLKRAERELARCGFYEDDLCMIIEVNYDENPWFEGSGLEVERADDEVNMTPAEYDHKWHGAYSDTVENAIIRPDWFDACVDAHVKLGWKPQGIEVVTHDPSDEGGDAKALAYRHGSVIVDCRIKEDGNVNDGLDWALDYALLVQADEFLWDGDGLGAGLRREVDNATRDKKIAVGMFKGSETPDYPDKIYEPILGEIMKAKPNKQVFANKRAQYYWQLRDRCFKTWQAVVKGVYHNPDDLISFASDIEDLPLLRSEICGIPKKDNGAGKIQIVSKPDIKKKPYELESPNMADCVMMTLAAGQRNRKGQRRPTQSNEIHGGWQAT